MRWTSFLAGVVVLIAAVAGVGLAMRQSTATPSANSVDETGALEQSESEPTEVRAPKDEGMVKSNPFALSGEGPQPKAVVDEIEHNFDRLSLGATGHHDFVIRNEGTETLTLAKGESTCQCTQFDLSAKEIPPGGSATVHLSWKPKSVTKQFEQSAAIWTNDPQQEKLSLTVTGSVVTLITRIPEGVWTVGTLSEGQSTTTTGVIASSLVDAFSIESIKTSVDHVQASYEPLSEEELKRLDALSGYSIKCTVSPNMPVGTFREQIDVRLSLAEAPEVTFAVQGSRIGPYQIIGPGWTQERHTLSMGRCTASQGKTAKVSLFVAVPDDVDLKFEPPKVTPPILNVSLQKDEAFPGGGGRQRYFIVLEAPAGITPGRWNGDTAINVALTNNHPTVSQAVFKVDFQAD